MIKSISELRKEKEVLENMRKSRMKMFDENMEKNKLKSEIRELKYPRTCSAIKTLKSRSSSSFKSIGSGVKDAFSKQLMIGAESRRIELNKKINKRRSSSKSIKSKQKVKRKKK